ncbi:NAD(P)-dependent alcohol dehydrogenase [Micromonospora sp. B11E3]|uniref:NAD(P)-dependent alcohol dehydrogenase n=1 Tax=Micromonospora sp. B11E3 TaxID=3153562 RepID=UPI00325CD2E5
MTITTRALVASAPRAELQLTTIERRDLRPDDVLINIAYAGICHSDIHQAREEWGTAIFPLVPGHEITGTVAAVGDQVTRCRVGDRVGVGYMVDSCGECEYCADGTEQFCVKGQVFTYNCIDYYGEPTYGGYSQMIVVRDRFVCGLPDGIDLAAGAPLLCAGITTYSPLRRWGVTSGTRLAVVGLGGLGHMAVRLASAMGAEVTVLSRTNDKQDDARRLGASDFFATESSGTTGTLRGRFDMILNTVSSAMPLDPLLKMLRVGGAMVIVGLPGQPLVFDAESMINSNAVLAGSLVGGIGEIQEMLEFCAQAGIGADIEIISADQVNVAYDRVVSGQARYRYVIDVSTMSLDGCQ